MILSMGGCSYGHLVKNIQLTGEFSLGQILVNVCLLLKPCHKQSQFNEQLLLKPHLQNSVVFWRINKYSTFVSVW